MKTGTARNLRSLIHYIYDFLKEFPVCAQYINDIPGLTAVLNSYDTEDLSLFESVMFTDTEAMLYVSVYLCV